MVLLGDLVFVPFNRLYWNDFDIGSFNVFIAIIVCFINIAVIWLFHRSLVLVAFDKKYGQIAGVNLKLITAFGVLLTSLNLVIAFECVGIVASIGMLVVPPATALLRADSIQEVIFKSVIVALLGTLIGLKIAFWADISIAGSLVMAQIFLFAIMFFLIRTR